MRYLVVFLISIVGWIAADSSHRHLAQQNPSGPENSRHQPSVDEILDHYVKALGGKEAIARNKSRVMTGTLESSFDTLGNRPAVENYWKSPDKSLSVMEVPGHFFAVQGFDGTIGFSQNPSNGFREMNSNALVHWKRNNIPHLPIKMKDYFTKLTSSAGQTIGGKDTNCLEFTAPIPTPDTWCFDSKSGLLVSRSFEPNAVAGRIEFLYEDYREVEGVKVPFLVRQTTRTGVTTLKYEKVQYNVALDDSMFEASKYRKSVRLV